MGWERKRRASEALALLSLCGPEQHEGWGVWGRAGGASGGGEQKQVCYQGWGLRAPQQRAGIEGQAADSPGQGIDRREARPAALEASGLKGHGDWEGASRGAPEERGGEPSRSWTPGALQPMSHGVDSAMQGWGTLCREPCCHGSRTSGGRGPRLLGGGERVQRQELSSRRASQEWSLQAGVASPVEAGVTAAGAQRGSWEEGTAPVPGRARMGPGPGGSQRRAAVHDRAQRQVRPRGQGRRLPPCGEPP